MTSPWLGKYAGQPGSPRVTKATAAPWVSSASACGGLRAGQGGDPLGVQVVEPERHVDAVDGGPHGR